MRGEQPGAGLGDEVVGGRVGERPGGSEGAHAPDHERGMCRVDVLPVEPESRGPLAGEIVQGDVGRAQDPHARRAPVLVLEIDDDGALPSVQRNEVPPDPRRDRHHVAIAVPARRLDLDDVGAEIRE